MPSSAGIYVHLPFCPYICPYCDFAKWPQRRSASERYLDALLREIDAEPDFSARTLFLGGGTPNTYDTQSLRRLLDALQRFGPFEEVSIEVNPELVSDDDLRAYVGMGITRLSVGVQSFVKDEIAVLGRHHTIEDVERVALAARAAGLQSLSFDLIFAVPGQTLESWNTTLQIATSLGPDHISCYGLTVEENTPYWEWRVKQPSAFADDVLEAELYDGAISWLCAHGYEQYEISNFARAGHRCAHNLNYWRNGEYRGFGVGAASYRDGERWVQTKDLSEYLGAIESGASVPASRERLVGAAARGEAVMLALRTVDGLDIPHFNQRYETDFLRYYEPVVERLRSAGLLHITAERATLSKRGRFLANDVCGEFVIFAS